MGCDRLPLWDAGHGLSYVMGAMMLLDLLYKIHRWTGVAVSILMVTWLVSGLVILYTGQIPQTRTQQLAHQQSLAPESGWLSLGQAWERSAQSHPDAIISNARLVRVANAPVWLVVDQAGLSYALSAIDGSLQTYSPVLSEDIAQQWLSSGEHKSDWAVSYLDTQDAPTSLRNYWDLKPFHRVALNDSDHTELLISGRTGEVLQAATRFDRVLYYTGSWLHFFRFFDTPTSGDTRRNVLSWTGFIAALSSLTGMIIGWIRWRPGYFGKPTYSQGRTQPYRSFFLKWHFWTGLIGGTFLVLWATSGYLNGNPWQIFTNNAASKAELNRFYGEKIPSVVTSWQPQALSLPQNGDLVELAWQRLGDQAVLLAYGRDGQRVVQSVAGAENQFDQTAIEKAAQRLVKGAAVSSVALLNTYDSYYYLYHNRDAAERPLPIIRVDLADAGQTHAYIDPVDGHLITRLDSSRRVYRWLFSAVHRWDLPGLYLHPFWDVWQWTWIVLGLGLSLTSVVLAWRWLRRKHAILTYALFPEKQDESVSDTTTLEAK